MNQIKNFERYRLHLLASCVVILTCVLVLIGWHADIEILKTVLPGYVTMKVNTALGLILFSFTAILLDPSVHKKFPQAQKAARILGFLGALFGFLTLVEYVFHVNLNIDEMFYKDLADLGPNYPSGRLAPITAISFILFGVALWFGPLGNKPRHRFSQTLFFIVALASFQALIEYMLGMQTSFGTGSYTRIAIHTALSFIFLSVGFLSLNSRSGHMRIFLSTSDAGILARNLVLSLLFMPPVFKFLVLVGEKFELIDSDFSVLVRSVVSITFFVTLVLRSAAKLHLSERLQQRVAQALQKQEKAHADVISSQLVADAVQASEARLRMIFSSTFDGIVGFNTQTIITEWNPQAEKIFGWSHDEAVGQSMVTLLYPEEQHESRFGNFKRICDTYDFSAFDKPIEVDTLTKSGNTISVRMGVSHTHIGGELLFIASIQDVSEEKRSEYELIRSREQALNATRSKSEFLANMSHEIRTPMNGVIGMATVLLDSHLTESQRESAKLIKQSAESLLTLINGILDHSKIEAGKLELEASHFSFENVAREVVHVLRLAADEKGIALKLNLETDDSIAVVGDPGRLRQILVNLTSNAIKFTEVGDVVLKITSQKKSAENVVVKFEVIDTGPGLTEAETQKLFRLYGQTETGMKKGGTGLGLYISSELIGLMNGTYGIESQLGVGSNFWFEINFPIGEKIEATVRNEQNHFLSGHVLVAEDQLVNQRVIGSYLAKLGVSFDIASNGALALQMLENSVYDLILMDCRMPVMDGYETTAVIREKEKTTGHHIPIVALSAEISVDDRKRCLELGMNEFLGKPLDIHKLSECLSKWLTEERERSFVVDESALEKLAGYTSGSEDLVSVLIGEFSKSATQSVDDMHLAFQNEDLKTISDLAHGLKSTSATLGLMRVTELCQVIESLPGIPTNMVSLISRLEVEVLLAETDLNRLRSSQVS